MSQNWDNAKKQYPTGILRHADADWAAIIKSHVHPHQSDVDWEEYCEWVPHGGGDDWFQEDDEDDKFQERMRETARKEQAFLAGHHAAQTILRTAYLCRDIVRPLSTPLDDRVIALALNINEQR